MPKLLMRSALDIVDACIHDGDSLGLRVVLDLHLQVPGIAQERVILHTMESCLLERVRRVEDELAQEDFVMRELSQALAV